jgi:site-specific DNA-methyltransferase (adenine-specific)
MKYAETKDYVLYKGTMQEVLKEMEKDIVDAIITDPPYELNFMGKGWDNSGVAFQKETWEHCFNVLKPGGYLLAFGGSRTYHRICCAIEDAGFEIRDCIMWLYGSGFPKSLNIGLAIDKKNGVESKVVGTTRIGKTSLGDGSGWDTSENMKKIKQSGEYEVKEAQNEWQGWGTCLKPAYEPIIVARKPFKGSLVDNVIENGVGGLNIDECRIEIKNEVKKGGFGNAKTGFQKGIGNSGDKDYKCEWKEDTNGRFPANVILTYDENDKQEVCSGMIDNDNDCSRYFYCAKASKKDRDEGLDEFEEKKGIRSNAPRKNEEEKTKPRKNIHPTVKPTELMQYLVRLVTPKGGTVLDCFMGSGSTGKAVMFENKERNANYKFIGIEMTEEYLPICEARINYAYNQYSYEEEVEHVEKNENEEQLTIFDFMEE